MFNNVKKFLCYMLFISSCFMCAPKRGTIHSVPVLLDYKLFYPDEALERGLEGKAIVNLQVSVDGKAENVKIDKTSGYLLLDSAAVRTAKSFLFSPAVVKNEAVRSNVVMPIEFRLRDIDFKTWINEVFLIQKQIDCWYRKEDIAELYSFYKKLIYSTRFQEGLEMNKYIKEAVLDKTAQLWKGYWSRYPASSILFIDIMYRYPDSFASLRAQADFNKFFKQERTRLRHTLSHPQSDTIINRLLDAMKD